MEKKLIYLDHAATSWPKPDMVIKAVEDCMRTIGGNPGRGSHRLAVRAADVVYTCRERAAAFFGCLPERVVITCGATMGLNMVISGYLRQGDHVLIDSMCHNAVYRPVYRLAEQGMISYDIYDIGNCPEDCLNALAERITPRTRMIVCTHCSNICGRTAPLAEIGRFCREHGILLVVDGAQSAGHLPISVDEWGITALCVPGHKGLLGPQGCGLILLGSDAPDCAPFTVGGSGSHSLDPVMPPELPEHLEAGTLPVPAIAGLSAGLDLLLRKGAADIYREALDAAKLFSDECGRISGITTYGDTNGFVFSFTLDGFLPSRTAEYLDSYGICVRSGYHCAPLAHRTIGSFSDGTVRVSFGYGNTRKDAVRMLELLEKLARREKQ